MYVDRRVPHRGDWRRLCSPRRIKRRCTLIYQRYSLSRAINGFRKYEPMARTDNFVLFLFLCTVSLVDFWLKTIRWIWTLHYLTTVVWGSLWCKDPIFLMVYPLFVYCWVAKYLLEKLISILTLSLLIADTYKMSKTNVQV